MSARGGGRWPPSWWSSSSHPLSRLARRRQPLRHHHPPLRSWATTTGRQARLETLRHGSPRTYRKVCVHVGTINPNPRVAALAAGASGMARPEGTRHGRRQHEHGLIWTPDRRPRGRATRGNPRGPPAGLDLEHECYNEDDRIIAPCAVRMTKYAVVGGPAARARVGWRSAFSGSTRARSAACTSTSSSGGRPRVPSRRPSAWVRREIPWPIAIFCRWIDSHPGRAECMAGDPQADRAVVARW